MENVGDESDFQILERLYAEAFSAFFSINYLNKGKIDILPLKTALHKGILVWPQLHDDCRGTCSDPSNGNDTSTSAPEAGTEYNVALIKSFQLSLNASISLDLISANENLDDIHTEHLKYLALTFLNAHTLMWQSGVKARLNTLERAQKYLVEFLNTMETHKLLPPNELADWSRGNESESIGRQRTKKIKRATLKRDLKEEITRSLGGYGSIVAPFLNPTDEESFRSLCIKLLQFFATEALDDLDLIQREIAMLGLGKEQDQRLERTKTPKSTALQGKPWIHHIGEDGYVDPSVAALLYRKMVLVPGHEQPTISLDECARIEMEMDVKTIGSSQEKKKKHGDGDGVYATDSESSQESEASSDTQSKAKWDDWKDENPRGIGNKDINFG